MNAQLSFNTPWCQALVYDDGKVEVIQGTLDYYRSLVPDGCISIEPHELFGPGGTTKWTVLVHNTDCEPEIIKFLDNKQLANAERARMTLQIITDELNENHPHVHYRVETAVDALAEAMREIIKLNEIKQ